MENQKEQYRKMGNEVDDDGENDSCVALILVEKKGGMGKKAISNSPSRSLCFYVALYGKSISLKY